MVKLYTLFRSAFLVYQIGFIVCVSIFLPLELISAHWPACYHSILFLLLLWLYFIAAVLVDLCDWFKIRRNRQREGQLEAQANEEQQQEDDVAPEQQHDDQDDEQTEQQVQQQEAQEEQDRHEEDEQIEQQVQQQEGEQQQEVLISRTALALFLAEVVLLLYVLG